MADRSYAGFEEKAHTADWELHVWGQSFCDLLEQALLGMNALSGVILDDQHRVERLVSIHFLDAEDLLVSLLNEIIFISEMEGVGFNAMACAIEDDQMRAQLFGGPIISLNKEIKAVTYHNLKVENKKQGLEAHIVFDV
ncbi:MAG: archease [Anaerolineales bacterium]|nr:archease [Anaerolineales bacterium]